VVTRIYPSTSDFESLSLLRIHASSEANDFDYAKVVVPKPWGYEYLWFQNTSVAVWMLHLTARSATSLHCHTRKRTSLIVMAGTIVCATIDSRYRLNAGDSVVLEPCVFHSSSSVSDEGVCLMEVEAPPLKGDLVRFRDNFGRAGQSYESASEYSTDLDSFDYQPLGRIAHGGNPFDFKGLRLNFSTFQRPDDFRTKLLPGGLLVPMLGSLVFGRTVVADIGEAISTGDVPLVSCPAAFPPVELLQVAPSLPKSS
jgi:mannose-6-phosphate isomerase-like protein (cupin superfamily)